MLGIREGLQQIAEQLDHSDPESREEAVNKVSLLFEQDRSLARGYVSESTLLYCKQWLPPELCHSSLSQTEHAWLVECVLDRLVRDPPCNRLEVALRHARKELAAARFVNIVTTRARVDAASWDRYDLFNIADTMFEFFAQNPDDKWAQEASRILESCDIASLLRCYRESTDSEVQSWGHDLELALKSYQRK